MVELAREPRWHLHRKNQLSGRRGGQAGRQECLGPKSRFITLHFPLQKVLNPQIAYYDMLAYCLIVCNYIIHIIA